MSEDKHFREKYDKIALQKLKANRRLIDRLNACPSKKADFKYIVEKDYAFAMDTYGECDDSSKHYIQKRRLEAEKLVKIKLDKIKETYDKNILLVRKMNLLIKDENEMIDILSKETRYQLECVIEKQIEILDNEYYFMKLEEQKEILQEWNEFRSKETHTADELESSDIYQNPFFKIQFVKEHLDLPWNWEEITCEMKINQVDFLQNMDLPWHKETLKQNGGYPLKVIFIM